MIGQNFRIRSRFRFRSRTAPPAQYQSLVPNFA